MNDELENEAQDDSEYVAEQEAEAAEDAAAIGGEGADYGVGEADVPLAEAGQGESEGFEQAEEQLIDNASHEEDSAPDPTHMAGQEEASDPTAQAYGEADSEEVEDA